MSSKTMENLKQNRPAVVELCGFVQLPGLSSYLTRHCTLSLNMDRKSLGSFYSIPLSSRASQCSVSTCELGVEPTPVSLRQYLNFVSCLCLIGSLPTATLPWFCHSCMVSSLFHNGWTLLQDLPVQPYFLPTFHMIH
jgi:hypothetical protein